LHKPALDSFFIFVGIGCWLTPELLPAIIGVNLSVGCQNDVEATGGKRLCFH
jgi:Mg2+-importing ATPase